MPDKLFMFLAEGVASEAATKRVGARHALMLFARAQDIATAETCARAYAERRGWLFVGVKRGKELSKDTSEITDDVLQKAAKSALENGSGLVIYKDEITPDS